MQALLEKLVSYTDAYEDYFMITGNSLEVTEPQEAMFYHFKTSGKYYACGLGFIPATNDIWSREELLELNGGAMPGLSGPGLGFRLVVIPENSAVYGWPQIKEPVNE